MHAFGVSAPEAERRLDACSGHLRLALDEDA
jgi:hypothetical protein